ncbi:MAG: flotillin domain-containing protein, partial [Hyphomicrobiales bacterium]
DRERALREREIEKDKALTLAEQLSDQEISKGSLAQMQSKAEAEKSRATLVVAEEQVLTAREKEVAERRKAVAIVEAVREAERQAVVLKLLAEAEKKAATDNAEADRIKAKADELRYKTDAEGERALNDARNLLSIDHVSAEVRKYLIDKLPEIIRQSSEPLKNIDSIRVVQTGDLGGSGGGSGTGAGMFDGALRYRAQAPIVDALLKDLGLGGDGTINPASDGNKK